MVRFYPAPLWGALLNVPRVDPADISVITTVNDIHPPMFRVAKHQHALLCQFQLHDNHVDQWSRGELDSLRVPATEAQLSPTQQHARLVLTPRR